MCDFYVSADPILYESRTRTVRIRGVSTSIRLEKFIWDTLAGMAKDEGMTTNALIVTFHDEILQSRGDVQNFTSFLRVTCLRYLDRKCEQLAEHLLQAQAHVPAPAVALEQEPGLESVTRPTSSSAPAPVLAPTQPHPECQPRRQPSRQPEPRTRARSASAFAGLGEGRAPRSSRLN